MLFISLALPSSPSIPIFLVFAIVKNCIFTTPHELKIYNIMVFIGGIIVPQHFYFICKMLVYDLSIEIE